MSEAESKIRGYIAGSCGNGGVPTDHTILCFIGMIETGEATTEDFQRIGGQYIVDRIEGMVQQLGGGKCPAV